MTLVTGGESPKHSKWHFMTGTVMLLAAFVVTMFTLERHLHDRQASSGSTQARSPAQLPSEPAPLRVASRE